MRAFAVTPIRVAGKGFRVHCAKPMAVLFHPCRDVGSIESDRFAVDGQLFMDLVADDRDLFVELLYLDIADLKIPQGPCARRHHLGESLLVDTGNALSPCDD